MDSSPHPAGFFAGGATVTGQLGQSRDGGMKAEAGPKKVVGAAAEEAAGSSKSAMAQAGGRKEGK